jgi:hypothetical protein
MHRIIRKDNAIYPSVCDSFVEWNLCKFCGTAEKRVESQLFRMRHLHSEILLIKRIKLKLSCFTKDQYFPFSEGLYSELSTLLYENLKLLCLLEECYLLRWDAIYFRRSLAFYSKKVLFPSSGSKNTWSRYQATKLEALLAAWHN